MRIASLEFRIAGLISTDGKLMDRPGQAGDNRSAKIHKIMVRPRFGFYQIEGRQTTGPIPMFESAELKRARTRPVASDTQSDLARLSPVR